MISTSMKEHADSIFSITQWATDAHEPSDHVTEAMALKQIEMDEKYGDLEKKRKEEDEANKKVLEPKAAIGFTYEDSTVPISTGPPSASVIPAPGESDSDGEADSDMDIDVELDLATLGVEGRRQLAKSASLFGLHSTDFVRLLDADQQLETELRLAKALEEEKLQLAGRKSRRARRILKERRSHEKFPKLFTTKVGLLNGQPISRRTVYLSASSSDSGEYPSEEDEVYVGMRGSSAKAAAAQARRARAKPLLSNAVGPSVMIGGMTSISLCRRRNHISEPGENVRKSGLRPSSSSPGSSRSRSSSSSTDRTSGRRLRREGGRSHGKRSRVEYITAFGEGTDDNAESLNKRHPSLSSNATSWTKNRSPGCATSSLAASVVSKFLDSSKRSVSPKKYGATVHHTGAIPADRIIWRTPADTCSVGKPSLTPQELLKRRMQAQLTKAFNADKKAELEKQLQLERERQLREEGLRRQALLLRRQEDKRARNERRAVAIASGSIPEDLSDSSSTSSDAQTSGRGTRSLPFPASHPDAPGDRAPPKHGALAVRPHSQRTPSPSRRSRLPSPPSSSRLRNPKFMQTTQSGMKFTSQDESRTLP
ncbi:splicing factor arginine/serine-rich 16 [Clonorchis sinensis]|uniref:Splicing factor arginine/serine-rich 16 n=1 Tax=Clonorchis sinensis TaxID=79923 RepID=G7YF43_CLOSI|nr:splicing factor arginine/serine-rich 16 [Clonorchis sinensis]